MKDDKWGTWIFIAILIVVCIAAGYQMWLDWSYKMAIIKSLGLSYPLYLL